MSAFVLCDTHAYQIIISHIKIYLKTHGYIIKHNIIIVKAAIVFITNSKKKSPTLYVKRNTNY